MADLDHEQIIVRTGTRPGPPVIIAVHSTSWARQSADAGCGITRAGVTGSRTRFDCRLT